MALLSKPIPMDPKLEHLLRAALVTSPMTPAQLREQRISFVYGNCAIDNRSITREMVERIHDEMYGKPAESTDPTCLLDRTSVRTLLIAAADRGSEAAIVVLAEVDELPIITAAEAAAAARPAQDETERLRAWLECIERTTDEEIKARVPPHHSKTEEEMAGKSVIYTLLSVPRSMARRALAGDSYLK